MAWNTQTGSCCEQIADVSGKIDIWPKKNDFTKETMLMKRIKDDTIVYNCIPFRFLVAEFNLCLYMFYMFYMTRFHWWCKTRNMSKHRRRRPVVELDGLPSQNCGRKIHGFTVICSTNPVTNSQTHWVFPIKVRSIHCVPMFSHKTWWFLVVNQMKIPGKPQSNDVLSQTTLMWLIIMLSFPK
jgi:hypothetical protein